MEKMLGRGAVRIMALTNHTRKLAPMSSGVIMAVAASGATHSRFGEISDILFCIIIGIVAIQTYLVIIAIDVRVRTTPGKRIAKAFVILITGTVWGLVIRTLDDRSSLITIGALIGTVIAAFL